ncbi:GntR family transcriptional regulator [Actinomadura macrotermitis]|uniref:HTH-type transcriptional repressor RspR n=1 Tax=Actinomadura macrotermitis TaxID=2585200 RepID=A0A7K0C875_9ACTN|nr:GntR family transcriptional regulator [Actinomadura macrotermitis]MQY09679.1 HTH-type transcriptional repressor RspR [Actinomadura macrotermitis]
MTEATVLDGIRGGIRHGEFVPGQRLVEADLMERFTATRAGVRQALADLAAEGLVERVPNKGARVRVVSVAEAVEITECRMALEGLCAAKAAERVTEADRAGLTGLVARMRAAVEAGDPLGYSDLNHQVHGRILEISAQRTAVATIERLRGQLVRHQFRLALQPDRPQRSLAEHERVVAAVLAGDPAAAEAAMRDHLRHVIDALAAGVR